MEAQTWAIVIFPEFALEQRAMIDRLRDAYDPLAAAIAPHITLVFPFAATLSLDDLLAHMRASVAAMPPFEIELRGVTGQEDEWLFLNVKRGNDEIIALHDRLYTGPLAPHLSPRHTYTPHLTVGHLARGERFAAALSAASSLRETLRATAREISAYRISTSGARGEKYGVALASSHPVPKDR
jgi:2'-5' RNA ligase